VCVYVRMQLHSEVFMLRMRFHLIVNVRLHPTRQGMRLHLIDVGYVCCVKVLKSCPCGVARARVHVPNNGHSIGKC
jgi:hypothetical protein